MWKSIKEKISSHPKVLSVRRYFDSDFRKNFVAGVFSGLAVAFILSGVFYAYLKHNYDNILQFTKHISEAAFIVGETFNKSQVVETPDGTKFYKYSHGVRHYDVIEDKDGKITLIYKGPNY